LFDPGEEFALPLFAAADEFVLPGFDFEFEFPDEPGALSRADEFRLPLPVDWLPRLLALPEPLPLRDDEVRLLAVVLDGRTAPVVSDHEKSRERFGAAVDDPPGAVITTSNLLPRCSTRAAAPGCKRNDRVVPSPLRCAVTSAKPRPRTASARGTSDAGIFT